MLTTENIESELSYAYLHAVASREGFACEYSGRHSDSAGVDARVIEDGRHLVTESLRTEVVLSVQLKATFQDLPESGGTFSFLLTVAHYDKLRSTMLTNPRILVVFRMPREPKEWLTVSEEALIAKRCAYWVSLRGAPAVSGQEKVTVYIPVANVLTPKSLTDIMVRFSRLEVIPYAGK